MRLGRRLDFDRLADSLRSLLQADIGQVYSPRLVGGRFEIELLHGAGAPKKHLQRALETVLHPKAPADSSVPGRAAVPLVVAYDPLRPEPWQRNRAVRLVDLQKREPGDSEAFIERCHTAALPSMDQLRLLACDGASLLAWVGCFRSYLQPFTRQEALLLQSLAPALVERLSFEARLRRGALAEAALDSALDAFPVPALVVDGAGAPAFVNRAARSLLDRDARGVRGWIDAALRGCETHFQRFDVGAPGLPAHVLLLGRAGDDDTGARVRNGARHWRLTPREEEILATVIRGLTNAAIGRELGCAERTVELHMTHLMEKADVVSRTQLAAAFWAMR